MSEIKTIDDFIQRIQNFHDSAQVSRRKSVEQNNTTAFHLYSGEITAYKFAIELAEELKANTDKQDET